MVPILSQLPANTDSHPTDGATATAPAPLPPRRLVAEVWHRLRPWRGRLILSLALLIFSVPFVNFHPAAWPTEPVAIPRLRFGVGS